MNAVRDIPLEGRVKGMIFDLDGVLFDSKEANILFYNKILEELGQPPMSKKDEVYCLMATGAQSLERIVPKELQGEPLKKAQQVVPYIKYMVEMLTLEKGVMEFLSWLHENGVKLGVHTNRIGYVDELLANFQLSGFFSSIKNATNTEPKPSPKGVYEALEQWELTPNYVVFVGDTKSDEGAAKNAGIRFWAFDSPSLDAEFHFSDFMGAVSTIRSLVE